MNDHSEAQTVAGVIRGRRSLRAFAPDPPADPELAALFEAARWAPSSGNGQPWRFVLARRGAPGFGALADCVTPGNIWAADAPVLALAVARTVHLHPDKPPRPNRLGLLELGLALGNLLVQAAAMGIVAHPLAGFNPQLAGKAARIPDDHEVATLVAIGFPGDPARLAPEVRAKDERARERLPLGEIVFEGRWGEASEIG